MISQAQADALAERVKAAMSGQDRAAGWMGMTVGEVRAGYARVDLQVRPEMLNGHGLCHGGVIFTLADTAFAYACNSHNPVAVALQCSITFSAPARAGDRLNAVAQERTRAARTGVYDVTVSNDGGTVVALFRGNSYQVKGTNVPEHE